MLKTFFIKSGLKYRLPYGFHLVEDLVPSFEFKDGMVKGAISKQAKIRQKMIYIRPFAK